MARSCLEMAMNILGRDTVDCGFHGPTCIIIKISGLGNEVLFGDVSLLEWWCGNSMHEKVAGVHS